MSEYNRSIKSIELYRNGNVKRIEFYEPTQQPQFISSVFGSPQWTAKTYEMASGSYTTTGSTEQLQQPSDCVNVPVSNVFLLNGIRRKRMKRGKIFNTNVVAPINHAAGRRCRKIFLPGNHEARLQKFLMAHPELFSLRDLELRNVLKLSHYDIEYAAYSVRFGDVLEVSHGTRVNKWAGMSAKAEQELRRYSMSTITGHVHRSGTFKTKVGDTWKTGQESPCLCALTPEYMRNPDWQQGITIFTVTDKICRIYPVEFSGQLAQFAKQTFKA